MVRGVTLVCDDLLLCLGVVELLESLVAQVAELSVGVLELNGDLLFVLLVAAEHFVLLVALVPLGGATDGLHPERRKVKM